jgi:hypothetical protein
VRIHTETTGAARYRGGLGLWPTAIFAIGGILICLVVGVVADRQRDLSARLVAVEKIQAGQWQTQNRWPAAYDAVAAHIAYLEADIEACHGRWDAIYSHLEDIGGRIRYQLPKRPPAPSQRLPADFCSIVASIPAAQGPGPCKPQQDAPPTMPALPEKGRAGRAGVGSVGGAR